MSITLQDIADQLGISKATVSRALRGDPLIRPTTRAQVSEMALRLGYRGRSRSPHHLSKKGSTGTLGLLFQAPSLAQAQQDHNLVQTMQGVMTESEISGMMLLVHAMRPGRIQTMEENSDEVPPMIRDRGCQAVIIRGMANPRDVAYLSAQLPVISIGRLYPQLSVDAVVADDIGGVRALVSRLFDLEHQILAWVGGHYSATFLEARQAGFIQGCLNNGLDLRQQHFFGPEIYDNRRVANVEKLLEALRQGVTALVCGNDSIALQVIGALKKEGIRVPQDVSVTGFDGWQFAASKRPVTSVDPNFLEIGRAAVRLATQRLTQVPTPPCTVVVRSRVIEGVTIERARSA